MDWETVIGLEIHAQLATRSKIFSGAATAYGAPPNAQASLVDLAYPGVLPVLNAEAVRMAVKFGLAWAPPWRTARCSRARTTSIRICPRVIRSASTSCPIVGRGSLRIVLEDGSEQAHRHHARASGGGCGQVAARGTRARERDRSEPRRHAAARDRLRTGHALGQRGGGVHEEDPHAGALPGDLRRQHAGGLVPLRRQRLGAPARQRQVRHARRDQESQFLPLRRKGDATTRWRARSNCSRAAAR